ncbi:MAG: type II toxin-antitoxin system RelE/ParE family toxin [Myxococcales bacterium]
MRDAPVLKRSRASRAVRFDSSCNSTESCWGSSRMAAVVSAKGAWSVTSWTSRMRRSFFHRRTRAPARLSDPATPLTGIGGGVLEVVEDFHKNTYRAICKVQLGDVVYVLHVFQKKSKLGKATPNADIDLIKSRLKLAKQDHDRRTKAKGKS